MRIQEHSEVALGLFRLSPQTVEVAYVLVDVPVEAEVERQLVVLREAQLGLVLLVQDLHVVSEARCQRIVTKPTKQPDTTNRESAAKTNAVMVGFQRTLYVFKA